MKIYQLEKKLLNAFPAETALEWDSTGLLVGDGNFTISKVAVALDPTLNAIRQASAEGCNILLTHHPLFFKDHQIERISPDLGPAHVIESSIFEATKLGIALMNFHTALDVSVEGGAKLPSLLGLKSGNPVVPVTADAKLGYGRYLKANTTVQQLLDKCDSIFKSKSRCWGDTTSKVKLCVTTTGSTGGFNDEDNLLCRCIDNKVDVLICGEIKYHDALTASNFGLNIIELGHDVSELPLVDVLSEQAINAGLPKSKIIKIDQHNNWI